MMGKHYKIIFKLFILVSLWSHVMGVVTAQSINGDNQKLRMRRQTSSIMGEKIVKFGTPQIPQIMTTSAPRTFEHYQRTAKTLLTADQQKDEELVEKTLQLIEEGDANIQLLPDHRDITLVAGNTGAGKSTITKFVTGDNSDMEAYQDHHRILIRDKENKISNGSSIVSKTSFPDLMIDLNTKSAFYDLPGFKDTRSPSMEIANAYFIKRVADHARSVKIIFIVNFSSMRPSESRTDFLTMLNHATKMIKNPKKFSPAMALIASKVESDLTNDEVVGSIARFIRGVNGELFQITLEESKLEESYDLLDNLLITSQNGSTTTYDRIGIFRQPNQVGPLSQVPIVQSVKPLLRDIIFNKLNYVPTTATDFGFALSPYAKSIAKKVLTRIHQRIVQASTNISRQILEKATAKLNNSNSSSSTTSDCSSINRLALDFKILQNATASFENVTYRVEIFNILAHLAKSFKIGDKNGETLAKKILDNGGKLDHFEKSSGEYLQASWREWTDPIRECGVALQEELQLAAAKLNNAIVGAGEETRKNLESSYNKLITDGRASRNQSEVRKILIADTERLAALSALMVQKTELTDFLSGAIITLNGLEVKVMENPYIHLQSSCNQGDGGLVNWKELQFPSNLPSPFQPQLWTVGIGHVGNFLQKKVDALTLQLRDEAHAAQMQTYEGEIDGLKTKMVNDARAAETNFLELQKQQNDTTTRLQTNVHNLGQEIEALKRKQVVERAQWDKRMEENADRSAQQIQKQKADYDKRLVQEQKRRDALLKEEQDQAKREADAVREKQRLEREAEIKRIQRKHADAVAEHKRRMEEILNQVSSNNNDCRR